MSAGKGDDQRPRDVRYCTADEFDARWDAVFGRKRCAGCAECGCGLTKTACDDDVDEITGDAADS